jgi:hypothetical protein
MMFAASYHDAMTEERSDRALLAIAKQLRDAALAAGRDDVVAKADEAIILLAGRNQKVGGADDRTNVVLRILDGLGF